MTPVLVGDMRIPPFYLDPYEPMTVDEGNPDGLVLKWYEFTVSGLVYLVYPEVPIAFPCRVLVQKGRVIYTPKHPSFTRGTIYHFDGLTSPLTWETRYISPAMEPYAQE